MLPTEFFLISGLAEPTTRMYQVCISAFRLKTLAKHLAVWVVDAHDCASINVVSLRDPPKVASHVV